MPLWAGRTFALLGIVLLALNLRTAVAALSPIVAMINNDVPLDNAGLGVLGMLPPVAFAASALVAPMLAKRVGLERLVVLSIAVAVVGHLLRAVSGSFVVLFVGSLLVFVAMGVGNVVLPPLVKRYFPDRIGMVTSLYATINAVGMAVPPLVAFPLADAAGWRLSLGIWAVLAVLALFPWIGVLVQSRRERAERVEREAGAEPEPVASAALHSQIWRSRTAWALALVFAVVSFHVYTLFAWLPRMLVESAGQTPATAGALLGLYSALGFPVGIIVPMMIVRMRNVSWMIYLGAVGFVLGYLGFIFAPSLAPWLWIVLIRVGSVMFPACLVLINLRSRTPVGSAALSGFVQAVGYALAALGPLLVGLLYNAHTGWLGAYLLLIATVVVAFVAGSMLRTPRFVEDELREVARRHQSSTPL